MKDEGEIKKGKTHKTGNPVAECRMRISGSRRIRYPWAMAPTINSTKLVAIAIATLYLARSRSARPLPSRLHRPCRSPQSLHSRCDRERHVGGHPDAPPVFEFFLFLIASNFSTLMDAKTHREGKAPKALVIGD
jgi:hypothetical protein